MSVMFQAGLSHNRPQLVDPPSVSEFLLELDRREHGARVEKARIATRLAHYTAQLQAAQS